MSQAGLIQLITNELEVQAVEAALKAEGSKGEDLLETFKLFANR